MFKQYFKVVLGIVPSFVFFTLAAALIGLTMVLGVGILLWPAVVYIILGQYYNLPLTLIPLMIIVLSGWFIAVSRASAAIYELRKENKDETVLQRDNDELLDCSKVNS